MSVCRRPIAAAVEEAFRLFAFHFSPLQTVKEQAPERPTFPH
jgi:hypothetical protein